MTDPQRNERIRLRAEYLAAEKLYRDTGEIEAFAAMLLARDKLDTAIERSPFARNSAPEAAARTIIYELVDCTNEETYWPLGLFATRADAIEAIAGGPASFGNPTDRDEAITVEIRERTLGWAPLKVGKAVLRKTWVLVFPDDDSDSHWKEQS